MALVPAQTAVEPRSPHQPQPQQGSNKADLFLLTALSCSAMAIPT